MVLRTLSAMSLSRHCHPIRLSSTIPYPTTASTTEIAAAEIVSTSSSSPWIGLFDVHPTFDTHNSNTVLGYQQLPHTRSESTHTLA